MAASIPVERGRLIGTWRQEVTFSPTEKIRTIVAFTADGVAQTTNELEPGMGLGVWELDKDGHKFRVTSYFFQHIPATSGFQLTGVSRVRATVEVGEKGDRFAGRNTIDQFDATEGTIVRTLKASVVGARMPIVPE
jgi:hypothetical protein